MNKGEILSDQQYFQSLIDHANKLIAERDFYHVSLDVMCCYNNMRSGWTEEISRIYHDPQTPEEEKLRDQMSQIILQTVNGLLETAKPAVDFFGFGDLEEIARLLYRLGDLAPDDQISQTKILLEESKRMGAPDSMCLSMPALEIIAELESARHARLV